MQDQSLMMSPGTSACFFKLFVMIKLKVTRKSTQTLLGQLILFAPSLEKQNTMKTAKKTEFLENQTYDFIVSVLQVRRSVRLLHVGFVTRRRYVSSPPNRSARTSFQRGYFKNQRKQLLDGIKPLAWVLNGTRELSSQYSDRLRRS